MTETPSLLLILEGQGTEAPPAFEIVTRTGDRVVERFEDGRPLRQAIRNWLAAEAFRAGQPLMEIARRHYVRVDGKAFAGTEPGSFA